MKEAIYNARVPLGRLRAERPTRVDASGLDCLSRNVDWNALGFLRVSVREDHSYVVIDGVQRMQILLAWAKRELGDAWEKFPVRCDLFFGLSKREEGQS